MRKVIVLFIAYFLVITALALSGCGDPRLSKPVTPDDWAFGETACASFGGVKEVRVYHSEGKKAYCENGWTVFAE